MANLCSGLCEELENVLKFEKNSSFTSTTQVTATLFEQSRFPTSNL